MQIETRINSFLLFNGRLNSRRANYEYFMSILFTWRRTVRFFCWLLSGGTKSTSHGIRGTLDILSIESRLLKANFDPIRKKFEWLLVSFCPFVKSDKKKIRIFPYWFFFSSLWVEFIFSLLVNSTLFFVPALHHKKLLIFLRACNMRR